MPSTHPYKRGRSAAVSESSSVTIGMFDAVANRAQLLGMAGGNRLLAELDVESREFA